MTSVPPGHPHNDHEPLCLPSYVIHDHMMTICHPHNDHEPFCVSLYAIHDHIMNIEGHPIYHPHYDQWTIVRIIVCNTWSYDEHWGTPYISSALWSWTIVRTIKCYTWSYVILIIIISNSPLCNMIGHYMNRLVVWGLRKYIQGHGP